MRNLPLRNRRLLLRWLVRYPHIRFAVANLHALLPLTTVPERHFSPPWSIRDSGVYFVVRDSSGQALAYVYYADEPGRRTSRSCQSCCERLDARQPQKQKAPLAGARYREARYWEEYPVAPPRPERLRDMARVSPICGQIGRSKCKHLGNSRLAYTSRQCAYPSI